MGFDSNPGRDLFVYMFTIWCSCSSSNIKWCSIPVFIVEKEIWAWCSSMELHMLRWNHCARSETSSRWAPLWWWSVPKIEWDRILCTEQVGSWNIMAMGRIHCMHEDDGSSPIDVSVVQKSGVPSWICYLVMHASVGQIHSDTPGWYPLDAGEDPDSCLTHLHVSMERSRYKKSLAQ